MYYYIYKITNINNGKFYIGSHKTRDLDDGYFGSGIYLKRAIKRYGESVFIKENILYCESEEEMLRKETEFLQMFRESNVYNLKFCSSGGNTRERYSEKQKQAYKQKLIDNPNCPIGKSGSANHMYGKKHTEEWKRSQSVRHKERFERIKSDPIEWGIWREKYMSHALSNQKLMAELNSKPVQLTHKITGEVLQFKTKTDCITHLGISSFGALERYMRGEYKNKSRILTILEQYKIELISTTENKYFKT